MIPLQPVVAHAGEEALFVLAPILLIMVLVQVGRRRGASAEQENAERDEGMGPPGDPPA